MSLKEFKRLATKYLASHGYIKRKKINGVFLPFVDPYVRDIAPEGVDLLDGWFDMEVNGDERWRRMGLSATIRIPVNDFLDYILIHYGYLEKQSNEVDVKICGDAGSREFKISTGHQVIVIDKMEISTPDSNLISIKVSDRYPSSENDPRALGLMIQGIATTSQFGGGISRKKSLLTGGYKLEIEADIDRFIGLSHHMANHSNDALLHYFTKFSGAFQVPSGDSASPEYEKFWLCQYKNICKINYKVENEKHDFSDNLIDNVYPYNTKDPVAIGNQLIAVGSIVRAFDDVPIGGSVLEMGVGWGRLALQLALSGYQLTVLDIEEKFIKIVKNRFNRFNRFNLSLNTICGDYFEAPKLGKKFDAILFFESFHHCIAHRELLVRLKKCLTPSAVIIFTGETITNELPYDWGLNPSGQGIWSIAHHGWMELCFHPNYFFRMLVEWGFSIIDLPCPQTAAGRIIKARLKS